MTLRRMDFGAGLPSVSIAMPDIMPLASAITPVGNSLFSTSAALPFAIPYTATMTIGRVIEATGEEGYFE